MKLLFELFTEELPFSEMVGLDDQIKDKLSHLLNSNNVVFKQPEVFITPRRIALRFEFEELLRLQEKKIVGPPESVCYKDGKPTKALEGFLRKHNATINDVSIEETPKGRYAVITIKSEAAPAKPVVVESLNTMLNSLHFNKKMRWGNGEYEFIRPVHNVLLLIDDKVEPFEFAGKKSTDFTYGHRFMDNRKINVSYESYLQHLKDASVIADQEERRKLIKKQLEEICENEGLDLIQDEELLDEVVNLTEFPVVVVGGFEERFLKLPDEVLITSMKDHQRYFAFTKNGKLANRFAAVSNIKTSNMDLIRVGYERVLKARFSDAEFFFEEDKKRPLASFVEELKNMMFQEKLGSQYDRTQRLMKLASFVAEKLGFDTEKAQRAAYLSKADLMTQMVYEFPELQGVMGREYALLSSEDPEVAEAIFEQYLPKENLTPKTKTGIALSIADKTDLIVGGFLANLKPTGAKDPYGLRRAALGIIRTLMDNQLFLGLKELLEYADSLYNANLNLDEIIDFIRIRFINYLKELKAYPHDALEAVTSARFNDIYDARLRLDALMHLIENDPDKAKRFAIKRVFNIVKDYTYSDITPELFVENEEKQLYEAIKRMKDSLSRMVQQKDYAAILDMVADERETINRFFDNVMVMDKDEALRKNRLALLNALKNIVLTVADFRFLEI